MNTDEILNIIKNENNLLEPEVEGEIVFVGDTHGDFESSQYVFDKLPPEKYNLVFLGDYVDRGQHSKENIDFLLSQKERNPTRVFLLQGNHEGYRYQKFSPVDFWSGLSPKESEKYQKILSRLPLAFSWNGIIATHGGLPDINSIKEIDQIEGGDPNWKKITWGDFNESDGFVLGGGFGRPQLGQNYFQTVMNNLNKKVMIRSHQPNAPLNMYDNRCLTIFTSSAYGTKKRIALAEGEVRTTRDLKIRQI